MKGSRLNVSTTFQFARSRWQQTFYAWSTILGRVQGRLVGAHLGRGVKFYGRPFLLRARSAQLTIGDRSMFRSSATSNLIGVTRPCILSVHREARLEIGNDCGFSGTAIGCFLRISIEDNVRCGANTLISDGDWHGNDSRAGPAKPILIKRNAWLGVNTVVLKGVTIGENSVVGAGSVVTKDIPDNVIAAGNPCRVIRSIDPKADRSVSGSNGSRF